MQNTYIFIPVIIQIALTLWLYISLAIAKSSAVKRGEVNEDRRALHDDAWPDRVLQINNCIRNQFEAPVLFYALVFMLWNIGGINIYIHIAAWLFTLSRIFHAAIHTGSNYVPLRRSVFTAGCIVLMGMSIFASYQLLSS